MALSGDRNPKENGALTIKRIFFNGKANGRKDKALTGDSEAHWGTGGAEERK
jgi:hypothetical protein